MLAAFCKKYAQFELVKYIEIFAHFVPTNKLASYMLGLKELILKSYQMWIC
jgi:hypothetical protein